MKILLSNHGLRQYGGSETWVKTMFDELSKAHTVHIYTPRPNTIFLEMPPWDPTETYDLGILNHSMCLSFLKDKNVKKIIFTSHGVIPGAEKPVAGADVYVAVSEEVQAVLRAKGFESSVIRNPINTERFTPRKSAREKLQRIAYVSNNPRSKIGLIKRATAPWRLEVVGREGQLRDVKPLLERSDLIIGLGRSAYEAMSMERNVIVFDYKGADGFVTTSSSFTYRGCNFSGRTNRFDWTEEQLQEAIRLYDPSVGPSLRDYIVRHNDVKKIAEDYLSL